MLFSKSVSLPKVGFFLYLYTISSCVYTPALVCVCVCALVVSCARLFETSWTVACQAPLSVGFSRQEYWRGLPFPSPGDLSDPEIEPVSPVLQTNLYYLSHQENLLM